MVAETVWVLQSYYGHSRPDIADKLVPLLSEHGLLLGKPSVVLSALETMAEKNVDFADALLAEAAKAGNRGVASFDRDFQEFGVEHLEPG